MEEILTTKIRARIALMVLDLGVGVVHPAVVPADVDDRTGDGRGGETIAAAGVDPGGEEARTPGDVANVHLSDNPGHPEANWA
jgi:hypothetical protein